MTKLINTVITDRSKVEPSLFLKDHVDLQCIIAICSEKNSDLKQWDILIKEILELDQTFENNLSQNVLALQIKGNTTTRAKYEEDAILRLDASRTRVDMNDALIRSLDDTLHAYEGLCYEPKIKDIWLKEKVLKAYNTHNGIVRKHISAIKDNNENRDAVISNNHHVMNVEAVGSFDRCLNTYSNGFLVVIAKCSDKIKKVYLDAIKIQDEKDTP